MISSYDPGISLSFADSNNTQSATTQISGLTFDEITGNTIPVNTWTLVPSGKLTSVISFDVFYGADRTKLTSHATRKNAQGNWEINSAQRFTDVTYTVIGEV